MTKLTYESKFGTTYENVFIQKVEAMDDDPRIKLTLTSELGEPIATITTQLNMFATTNDLLVVKDHSENEGMYQWLRDNDLVTKGDRISISPFDSQCWLCKPTDKLREVLK